MKPDFQSIKGFLDRKEHEADNETLMSWFSDLHSEESIRKHYRKYWDDLSADYELSGYDEEKMLGSIYRQIKLNESEKLPDKPFFNRFIHILTRVAAILFIPLTIFVIANREHLFSGDGPESFSEIYAPFGTRTQFTLPDGSSGYLNGGSTIKFPTRFTGKTRDIKLVGEAFFKVQKNAKKPFIVHSAKLDITVLGTSFNVESFPEDKFNRITLVEGKVKITEERQGKSNELGILSPDQMFQYRTENSSYDVLKVDAKKIASWTEGNLVFIDTPFEEVIEKLNRYYSVNIVIKDTRLKEYTYLATFKDETLDQIIELLKISAPIRVIEKERKKKPDGMFEKRTIEFYYNTTD